MMDQMSLFGTIGIAEVKKEDTVKVAEKEITTKADETEVNAEEIAAEGTNEDGEDEENSGDEGEGEENAEGTSNTGAFDLLGPIVTTNKNSKKGGSTGATTTASVPKRPEEPPYRGPRIVKAYGRVYFTEDDPDVPNDTIRQRLVDEFDLGELTKEETQYKLYKDTGILLVGPKFEKKG